MEVVATIDERQTKELLKAVLVELIEERPTMFSNIVLEVLEDVGLARAIREGREDDFVSEDQIMAFTFLEAPSFQKGRAR